MARRRSRRAPATPPADPPPRRTLLDRIREAPKLFAAIGTIVAAIAGVLALVTWVFPDWRNDPPRTSVEILEITRDPNVRYGDFLGKQKSVGRPKAELRAVGNVFTLQLDLKGLKGEPLPLKYTIFDADSRTALPRFKDRLGATLRSTTRGSEGERGAVRIWIPLPPRSGSFFVRFDIYDENEALLVTEDAEPFPVTAAG